MIITSERVQEATKRLENMKQATLLNYLDEIDFDNKKSWYDVMMKHFFEGDLKEYFYSDILDKSGRSEKGKLINLSQEYVALCFLDGDVLKWNNSVSNTVENDYDLICLKILDNYNFLLNVSKNGGREVLELLNKFQAYSEFRNGAVVEILRNIFVTDSILISILIKMAKRDSEYNIFTDEQKAILCSYPEGVLYTYDDKDMVSIISPVLLADKIKSLVIEETDNDENALISEIVKVSDFTNIVAEISMDYGKKYGKALEEMMKFINDLESQSTNKFWNTDSTSLEDFVDTVSDGLKK